MLANNYMTTSKVGRSHSVRSLFSKFDTVTNEIISDYISSFPESLSEAVERLLAPGRQYPLMNDMVGTNRARIGKHIEKFHNEAGTSSSNVNNSLNALNSSSVEILVSIHQPNLFAFAGVYKKIILLQCLKSLLEDRDINKKFVNMFLIVDHDFMDEFWIRHAQLPSLRHSNGILELRLPIRSHDRWRLMCNMQPPRHSLIDHWRKQVTSWIKNMNSSMYPPKIDKPQLLKNLNEMWDQVTESYSRCKTYADLNSFIISRLVNTVWGYDTLFVRLSDISDVFEDGFKFLISNYKNYALALSRSEEIFASHGVDTGVSSNAYLNAPVWLHCRCGSKGSAKIVESKLGRLYLVGKCIACKNDLRIEIGSRDRIDLSGGILHSLSPRAIPILLLLARDLGIGCYASGTGGSLGYMLVGNMAFKQMAVNMPQTIVWPSVDIYNGIGQLEALTQIKVNNENELKSYLQRLKTMDAQFAERITPLIDERASRIKAGQPITDILSNLFKLKESQRKVRRMIKIATKARATITLKPCIIDQVVNFGLTRIEAQWKDNILVNDDLAAPIFLT